MHQAGIDVEAVDAERIAIVSNALGRQRFCELLTLLSVRLQCLSAAIDDMPADVAGLIATLHQSRGSAASLGLPGLAAALTDIEARITHLQVCDGTLTDLAAIACVKIAGRALPGYGRAASRAASRHMALQDQDHASGICIT